MSTITFVGCGAAFNTKDLQSNMLITADSGKKLLVDCGSFAPFALEPFGIHSGNIGEEIDGVYISHCHADHIGGLEWMGFSTYFNPSAPKPKMFIVRNIVSELWRSLRSGLQSLEGKVLTLPDFFDVNAMSVNSCFVWEGIKFCPVQTIHIMNGFEIVDSYGLLIGEEGNTTFLTTDTQFAPRQIEHFYDRSKLVFQDCETSPFKSGVHAHFDDLKTLPEATKEKMWLYHYQPDPEQDAEGNGFCGFIQKGQTFEL